MTLQANRRSRPWVALTMRVNALIAAYVVRRVADARVARFYESNHDLRAERMYASFVAAVHREIREVLLTESGSAVLSRFVAEVDEAALARHFPSELPRSGAGRRLVAALEGFIEAPDRESAADYYDRNCYPRPRPQPTGYLELDDNNEDDDYPECRSVDSVLNKLPKTKRLKPRAKPVGKPPEPEPEPTLRQKLRGRRNDK